MSSFKSRGARRNSQKSVISSDSRGKRRSLTRQKSFSSASEMSFRSQEDLNDYNVMARGYKSPFPGFGEDFFVNMLKTQYVLEQDLERMKEQIVI